MQLTQFISTLRDDDSAVSPVIGVILMVAITVILAAVIATFVLGLGESVSSTAPQASFDFNSDDDSIVMSTGDELDGANVKVTSDGSTIAHQHGENDGTDEVPETITSGDELLTDDQTFDSSSTVRVVWNNGEGSSATIGSYNT